MIVFRIVFGHATDDVEPTALNSNLFPVKANGLVRLRSPLCLLTSGIVAAPKSKVPPSFAVLGSSDSICSRISLNI